MVVTMLFALSALAGQRPVEGGLIVGDPAPNFNLLHVDGKSRFELRGNFGKRPTVLIFGSYT